VSDRARLVRETQRRTWSRGTRDYAVVAAGHGAHTALLVAKVGPRLGERVLDVGTGSGVVAVAAAAAVGPTGRVVATDLVPEWGDIVAAACAAPGWGTLDKVEHQAVGRRVLAAHIPPPPPAERQPTPTELGEPGLIERLVAEAGFREIAVDRRTLESTYESLDAYWRHLTFSDYTRAALGRLPVEQVERIRDELGAALAEHQRDGRLSFASEAIYVTATR